MNVSLVNATHKSFATVVPLSRRTEYVRPRARACANKDSYGLLLHRDIETGICMSFEDQARSKARASCTSTRQVSTHFPFTSFNHHDSNSLCPSIQCFFEPHLLSRTSITMRFTISAFSSLLLAPVAIARPRSAVNGSLTSPYCVHVPSYHDL
jgi:hypothetical protein